MDPAADFQVVNLKKHIVKRFRYPVCRKCNLFMPRLLLKGTRKTTPVGFFCPRCHHFRRTPDNEQVHGAGRISKAEIKVLPPKGPRPLHQSCGKIGYAGYIRLSERNGDQRLLKVAHFCLQCKETF